MEIVPYRNADCLWNSPHELFWSLYLVSLGITYFRNHPTLDDSLMRRILYHAQKITPRSTCSACWTTCIYASGWFCSSPRAYMRVSLLDLTPCILYPDDFVKTYVMNLSVVLHHPFTWFPVSVLCVVYVSPGRKMTKFTDWSPFLFACDKRNASRFLITVSMCSTVSAHSCCDDLLKSMQKLLMVFSSHL